MSSPDYSLKPDDVRADLAAGHYGITTALNFLTRFFKGDADRAEELFDSWKPKEEIPS